MDPDVKVVYTGKTHVSSGGRNGSVISSDGLLNVKLSPPGSKADGTNPEQLFAAGWSACFIGAMGLAAAKLNVELPANLSVDAEVDLCSINGDYFLQAHLNVSLPGMPNETVQALVYKAHQTCPYSKAIRRNIEVEINVL